MESSKAAKAEILPNLLCTVPIKSKKIATTLFKIPIFVKPTPPNVPIVRTTLRNY